MKLILIAPSGGGKGSLADLIVKDYKIPNISTGDIFRKNIKEKTPLGLKVSEYVNNGLWVPDELTVDMLMDRLKEKDCANGYILDGFPRTLNQAKVLAQHVDIDSVIELDVSDELVIERLAGRWTCKGCNYIWNSRFDGFKASACGKCDAEIFQRDDDKEEMILKRLKQYRDQNCEILDFYRQADKLYTIPIKPEYYPPDTYAIVRAYFEKKGLN
jgi:adenylate kinase